MDGREAQAKEGWNWERKRQEKINNVPMKRVSEKIKGEKKKTQMAEKQKIQNWQNKPCLLEKRKIQTSDEKTTRT